MVTSAKNKPNFTTKRTKAKLIKPVIYGPRIDFLPGDHATYMQYMYICWTFGCPRAKCHKYLSGTCPVLLALCQMFPIQFLS